MKRVGGVIGGTAAVALFVCFQVTEAVAAVVAGFCLLAVVAVRLFPHREIKRTATVVFLSAAVAIGLFLFKTETQVRTVTGYSGQTVSLSATVVEVTASSGSDDPSYILSVTGGELPVGTRLRYWQTDSLYEWEVGDGLSGTVTVSDARLQAGDESILPTSYAQGIYLYSWPAEYRAVSTGDAVPLSWYKQTVTWLRGRALEVLSRMGGSEAGLAGGLCLGEKSAVSETIIAAFRRSGVSHLLAISGLHVSLLAALVYALWSRFLSARLSALLTLPVVAAFACLMGLTASVTRAALMAALVLVGQCFFRQAEGLNSLGWAFAALAVIDPFCLCDVGLLLSFGATLGILVAYRPVSDWLLIRCRLSPPVGWRRLAVWPVQAFALTISACWLTWPLSALVFGEWSLLSPLSNLLVVWPAEGVLITGWLAILLAALPGIGTALSAPCLWAARGLSRLLIVLTQGLSSFSWATVTSQEPYLLLWMGLSAAAMAVAGWLLKARGVRLMALASAVVLAVSCCTHTLMMQDVTSLTMVSRYSSSVVMITQNGHTALLLTGDKASWKSAKRLVDSAGVEQVDLALMTTSWNHVAAAEFAQSVPIEALWTTQEDIPNHTIADHETVSLWEDSRLVADSGFVWLTFGQTTVLLCPSDGDVTELSEDYQQVQLVIYQQTAPQHVATLSAAQGVWLCPAASRAANTAALPWGVYAIAVPDEGTSYTIMTRGTGDLTAST